MTSVGIEPTTSGLDLPLLCQLSYEVGQRKSGTIKVVNRGEEKVRVHIICCVCLRLTKNLSLNLLFKQACATYELIKK